MTGRFLALLLTTLLAGCAAVSGFPRPVFNEREEAAELALYMRAGSVQGYEDCTDRLACRNRIVDARLRAIDISFYRFQRRLYSQESGASMGTNMLSLAMDSIATVTATRGFAAGAGLLAGGRDAYSRQAMSVSMPLLLQEMAANRREILVRIRTGLTMPVVAYSLVDALGDLNEYELAGSIPAAAAQLAANAGSQARVADEKLAALRATAFAQAQAASVAAPVVAVAAPAPVVAVTPAPVATPSPTTAAAPSHPSTGYPWTGPSTDGAAMPPPFAPPSATAPAPPSN